MTETKGRIIGDNYDPYASNQRGQRRNINSDQKFARLKAGGAGDANLGRT